LNSESIKIGALKRATQSSDPNPNKTEACKIEAEERDPETTKKESKPRWRS